jgi:hypothetical protein
MVKNSAFAVFRPEFKKLGKIKDISDGGLSCEYLNHKNIKDDILDLEIDILLTDGNFYMSMIPCKVVYDMKTIKNRASFFNDGLECRRCGLKFKKLPTKLRQDLKYFLKNHIV